MCKTAVVIPSYGNRANFLKEVVRRCLACPSISRVIIVGNKPQFSLRELVDEFHDDRVIPIALSENTGSANAYSVGISAALEDRSACDHILLLDDDNAPEAEAFEILRRSLREVTSGRSPADTAILGYRPPHQSWVGDGISINEAFPLRSSFQGFHVVQIPRKIFKRMRRRRAHLPANQTLIKVPYAPYGGLFAHRSLYERLGLPKKEFVLYADDTEYTARITAAGGDIFLVPAAIIRDLEESWNNKKLHDNAFLSILRCRSSLRLYYGVRNQTWLEAHAFSRNKPLYYLNLAAFVTILTGFALWTREFKSLALFLRAAGDGLRNRLGLAPEFPLP